MSTYRGPEVAGEAARRRMAAQQARLDELRQQRGERRTYATDATLDAQRTRQRKRWPKRMHGRGTPWVGFVPSRFTHTPGPRPEGE